MIPNHESHQKYLTCQILEGSEFISSSQHNHGIGAAATIQFQPGIRGLNHFGGVFQTIEAGAQKQEAIQTQPVRVGVI